MQSLEYQNLRARLAELKGRFVDFDIPIERDPNSTEMDNIAAFKLLMRCESRPCANWRAGLIAINTIAARIAIKPITTRISISVKPRVCFLWV